ncbi:hypothetical protein B0H17DRAFT_1149188 [Mycena rosella]|uniref:Uncharacterized protein n=1 Tax=Mycena rosella TaxID=1033263 RepID=A0AAD7FS15_MYCRO|nr:hypothetical protein B0H17DRAFT_1149188 [Mycena rosella]
MPARFKVLYGPPSDSECQPIPRSCTLPGRIDIGLRRPTIANPLGTPFSPLHSGARIQISSSEDASKKLIRPEARSRVEREALRCSMMKGDPPAIEPIVSDRDSGPYARIRIVNPRASVDGSSANRYIVIIVEPGCRAATWGGKLKNGDAGEKNFDRRRLEPSRTGVTTVQLADAQAAQGRSHCYRAGSRYLLETQISEGKEQYQCPSNVWGMTALLHRASFAARGHKMRREGRKGGSEPRELRARAANKQFGQANEIPGPR